VALSKEFVMALISEIRKNVTDATPLLAVVGVTDLAAERIREAAAGAGHLQQEVEKAVTRFEARPKQWRARVRELDVATVQQAPGLAAHRAKEWAQEVEKAYEHLAERGRDVVERARQAAPTQDFLRQGKATLGRAQAAVTTARRAVDDTVAAARDALTVGRREARDVVGAVETEVADSVTTTEKVVTERTQGTRVAVRDVAETVRRQAASARAATRTATSSVRETARKALVAVEAVVGQIGEEPRTPAEPRSAAPADEAGAVAVEDRPEAAG
jgi:hypothetical protein